MEIIKSNNNLLKEEGYTELLDTIDTIRKECYKQATEITLQWRGMVGKAICDEKRVYGQITKLSQDTGISVRSLNDYMLLYKKYKADDGDKAYMKIPQKNYTSIMKELRNIEECKHENIECIKMWKCRDCGRTFKSPPQINNK